MSVDISHESAEFIDEQVAAGTFSSRGEALDEAVRLLQARTEVLRKVDEGRHQLDSGDFEEYDDETLAQWFEVLKEECLATSPSDLRA